MGSAFDHRFPETKVDFSFIFSPFFGYDLGRSLYEAFPAKL